MWHGNNIAMFLKEYITLCTNTRHTIDALTSFNIFQQINFSFDRKCLEISLAIANLHSILLDLYNHIMGVQM